MMPHDRIGQLAQQIGDRLQNASQAPEDIQKGVQQVMRGAFDRLELVSREDFDILMDVLQRTRTRVEALEDQVADLEAAIKETRREADDATAAVATLAVMESESTASRDTSAESTASKPAASARKRTASKSTSSKSTASKSTTSKSTADKNSPDQGNSGPSDA